MNNFQNSFGKFVSTPITLANRNGTYGQDEKKPKSNNETRPTGALKIFYESKYFHVDEPRCEWNSSHGRRKKATRHGGLRTGAEGKKKSRKNEKRTKHEEGPAEENNKRTCLLAESQVSKTRPRRPNSRPGQKQENVSSHVALTKPDWLKSTEIAEKYLLKTPDERPTLKNSLTLPRTKGEAEKKVEKPEIKPRGFPFSSNKSLARKTSEKMATPSTEMKATISDSGKRRINEILKNHAQKVPATPAKTIQIKDYTANVLDTQKKGQNVSNELKDAREPKSVGKNEEVKPEVIKTEEKPKEKGRSGDKMEEKKKLPDVWLKLPQSNELERRLKNSWHESGSLLSNKCTKTIEDEKNSSEKEDDSKNEKRVTYTDRLLLLKMLGKNLEDKKEKARAEEVHLKEANNQGKQPSKENSESLPKKSENALLLREPDMKLLPTPGMKDMITTEKKSYGSLKDTRNLEADHMYKTKQTRSTELRDLVAQAIKEHKIFCIFDNHTYIVRPVREELLSRGWLEVIPDRRLIPRRRPPPMGPIYERDRTLNERNTNTLEAILAAKETFADEIQDTVSKSSFRFPTEKPKIVASTIVAVSKKSEESLTETLSLFRIAPPTAEKKKTNCEIREFVAKCQSFAEKEKEREKEIRLIREKERNVKLRKKERFKLPAQVYKARVEDQQKLSPPDTESPLAKGTKSFQEIWDSINDNKKMIVQASTEIKGLEATSGGKVGIGVLYNSAQKKEVAAIEGKKEEDSGQKTKTPVNASVKTVFSDSEAKTISKIIQSYNARIHFMWLSIKPGIHLKCFNYSPEIINKFQKTSFCTKIGLWSHLNNMQWYAHEVIRPAKSPRMYNTGEADDMQAFFQDFQLTACIGMLKWLSDTFFERGLKAVQTKRGKVPLKAFEFAIKQCEKYMRFKENEELNLQEEPTIHQDEWNTFLQWFYIITNDHGKVQESSSAQLMVIYTKAVETLKMMKRHWPEIDIDGRLNIWIMKPYCASCGRGIFMTNNVYYISQHSKYIVQKYIEKPLLIYNTKFDIRQWFMITKLTPLEIWMYKECYLRFCSQPFALRNLHESVHLSNNSVQRKYISVRDSSLPDQNMWDSNTFQLYLKTIGHPKVWEDVIYPGMRDAIVSTMLAAQDTFDGPRKSWFEVYGADFMLSSNVKDGPWLIEINENPAMDPSTKVTARLCPQMLRDVIKVVVDKRANKNASTGQWELIYRQNYSPSFGTVDLDVRGKKIARIPCTTKVSLDVPTSSPKSTKVYDPNTVGPSKLYEFVKTFGTNKKPKKGLTTMENKGKDS